MMDMQKDDSKDDDRLRPSSGPIGLLVFVVLVVASIYRLTLGIQFAGAAVIWTGFLFVRTARVPYGWRGQPPSGYITGIPAVVTGLAVIGLGIYMLARPEAVAAWGRRH
jgi:hypothetical protein